MTYEGVDDEEVLIVQESRSKDKYLCIGFTLGCFGCCVLQLAIYFLCYYDEKCHKRYH